MATTTTTELVPGYLDVTRLAVASFPARYREPALTAYTQDIRAYLGWCLSFDRDLLRVTRGELETNVRHLEGCGYAAATIARRFGTLATFSKYAVIDGVIPANPAAAVTRPKVAWEGQKHTVLHPLEFAAPLAAARTSGPNDHALVCLLGMLGLRISQACGTEITDLRYEAGYELLHVLSKGAKPADIPLPIPVLRAVREAVDGRSTGPILRPRTGRRMDWAGASRALTRVAHAAGITRPISPHGPRRTFCESPSQSGPRRLRCSAGTEDALRQHRDRQLAQQNLMGAHWQDLGLVFPTSRGTLLDPANPRRSLRTITERAGLGRWHPHELRHSAASLLSAAGVPLEEVADVLGHSSTRITSATYRHKTTATVEAGAGPMEQIPGASRHNTQNQII